MLVPFVHFPRGLACFAIFLKGLPGHRYSVGTLSSAFLAFVSRFCTLSKSIFGFVHSPKKGKGDLWESLQEIILRKAIFAWQKQEKALFNDVMSYFFHPSIILINF